MTYADEAGPADAIVIGGGIAGVALGSALATDRRVAVLDMEPTLAFHTTGRSAAMYLACYGGPAIRAVTTAGREYLEDAGVLRALPYLNITVAGRDELAVRLHRDVLPLVPDAELLDPDDVVAMQPLLVRGEIGAAVLEPRATEIDVHALHQGFVRQLREHGGAVAVSARVVSARRTGDVWTVTDADGRTWQAPLVVDAAGAWADQVAGVFGAEPVGLRALRRSAFMIDAPPAAGPPMFSDIENSFYVKPDVEQLLCSPAEETEQQPADARPDTYEIARAIDVINRVTTLDVRHVRSSWAGLRNFVADRSPVVGRDPHVDGFFWYAAQGGYGIQTAPGLARVGAALIRDEGVPPDIAERGLRAADLAPDRAALRATSGNA